jgi:splicing factor 3A subunit 1
MDKISQGDLADDSAPDRAERGVGEGAAEPPAAVDIGKEPPVPEFIMDLPNISAIDL